jgi:hypothetical protein
MAGYTAKTTKDFYFRNVMYMILACENGIDLGIILKNSLIFPMMLLKA